MSGNYKMTGLEDLSTDDDMSDADEAYIPPDEREPAYAPPRAALPESMETKDNPRAGRRVSKRPGVERTNAKLKTQKRKREYNRRPKPKSTGTPHCTGPFKPIRPYYHSTSFLRIKDNEWEKDIDSDNELDQSWLHEIERSDIHDFTDILEDEKKMMLLWNEFARSDVVIPAKKIPQMCLDFVEKHYELIRDEGLDAQLPIHLANLWDEGLISSRHLSFCLDHYHALAGSPPLPP